MSQFDLVKWNTAIQRVDAEIDHLSAQLKSLKTRRTALISAKEFLVEKAPHKTSTPSPGPLRLPPKGAQQSLAATRSYSEMIISTLNRRSGIPAREIARLIEYMYSEEYGANNIPDEDEVATFIMRWLSDPKCAPNGVRVQLSKGVKYAGEIVAKLPKDSYTVEVKTDPLLNWVVDYCRKNNHHTKATAIGRRKLYVAASTVFPDIHKRPGGISRALGTILNRLEGGMLSSSTLHQYQEKPNSHKYIWATD